MKVKGNGTRETSLRDKGGNERLKLNGLKLEGEILEAR